MTTDINTLIRKHLSGDISPEEQEALTAFLASHPDEAEKFEKIVNADNFSERYEEYASVDTQAALQRFMHEHAEEFADSMQTRRKRVSMLRYAAAILMLIIAGAGYWYSQYTKVTPPEIPEAVQMAMQQSIQNGKADAVIEEHLAISGEHLEAGSDQTNHSSEITKTNDEHRVSGADEQEQGHALTASESLTKEQLMAARRITTRHDKEFWLTLDDGTLVHLNYNTHLIYPEKFGRSNRNVILDGEAYFMVAKDKSRPFIVHTRQGYIKVYGTEFNVNTRCDNSPTSVVLVKGSVGVTPINGREQMMKPGQQVSVAMGQSSVSSVDVTPYVAWNEGSFVFENTTLEQLMRVMAQWYSVRNVVFKDNRLRQIHFTGSLQRYGDINRVVKAITTVCDVEVTKQGDVLIISSK